MSSAFVPQQNGAMSRSKKAYDAMANSYRNTVANVLGDVDVTRMYGADLDAFEDHGTVRAGLALRLDGRATVVQAKVRTRTLLYFQWQI